HTPVIQRQEPQTHNPQPTLAYCAHYFQTTLPIYSTYVEYNRPSGCVHPHGECLRRYQHSHQAAAVEQLSNLLQDGQHSSMVCRQSAAQQILREGKKGYSGVS
ncbi:MAG: hypothetical protein MJA30_37270, partial [Cytophagales bacterium]|nr:hypothetical protein [Cytophagales bacterium]